MCLCYPPLSRTRNLDGLFLRNTAHQTIPPLSERLCDAAVTLVALWTLSCHVAVVAGGSLKAVMALFGAVVAALLAQRVRRRTTGESLPPSAGAVSPGMVFRSSRRLGRAVAAAAGLGGAVLAASSASMTLWWWWIALVLAAAAVLLRHPPAISRPVRGRHLEIVLWALALACVFLTLVCHRPDFDDAFYVNVAVAAVDRPELPLMKFDTMHGIAGLPIHLPIYRVHSFELLNAALSQLTGVPAIYCFHWISASVAALLVPLAYARLLRRLIPRWWLFGVVALVVVLVAVGDTPRWYGNFSFVRLWQGKSIFLSVFLPLIYAHALEFALRPTRGGWLLLAAAQVAALGCSSSALWAAPVAAAAALASALAPTAEGLRRLVLGAFSSAYVLVAGLALRGSMERQLRAVKERLGLEHQRLPTAPGEALADAFHEVFGDSRLWLCALAAILLAWALAPGRLARRFSVAVPLVVWIGLLNPYVGPWVSDHVTGPSYWRSLWALPVPLLMTLLLISPLGLGESPKLRRAGFAGALLLVVLFALLIPEIPGLSQANRGVRLGLPGLKVEEPERTWAGILNESVGPGAYVLAPPEISRWVPTFHRHAYPLIVRQYLRGRIAEEERRLRASLSYYVDGLGHREAAAYFRQGLERFHVDGVCLRSGPEAKRTREMLRSSGFVRSAGGGDYEIWVRRGGREPGKKLLFKSGFEDRLDGWSRTVP